MKTLLSIFRIFSKFYWVKKEIIFRSKSYLINYHILPIIKEINNEKIYDDNFLTLKDAVLSEPFKNGLIDHFLNPNSYMLNTKDIAIAINMGVSGHSNSTFLKDPVIDAAFYLTKKLKERFILDDNLKYIINELGKNISEFTYGTNRDELESIFSNKKLIFKEYFSMYNSVNYTEKITIYYPGYEKSWVDRKEEESLKVSIYKYDIPRGFFLAGFYYQSDKNGWLSSAIRTREKEYFNDQEDIKGEAVWLS